MKPESRLNRKPTKPKRKRGSVFRRVASCPEERERSGRCERGCAQRLVRPHAPRSLPPHGTLHSHFSHSTFLENKTSKETPPGSPNGRPRLLNRVLLLRAAVAAVRQTDGLPTTLLLRRERPGAAPSCSLASSVSPQRPACHQPGPASLPMVAGELCESQRAASAPGHPGGEGLTTPRLSRGCGPAAPPPTGLSGSGH